MAYVRGSLHRHEELKALVCANPELIGIKKEDVISVETELPLTKKKRAVAQPDIVIMYYGEKGVRRCFVEVKSGNCRRSRAGLEQQLKKITNYVRWKRIEGEVIGVYPTRDTLRVCTLEHCF